MGFPCNLKTATVSLVPSGFIGSEWGLASEGRNLVIYATAADLIYTCVWPPSPSLNETLSDAFPLLARPKRKKKTIIIYCLHYKEKSFLSRRRQCWSMSANNKNMFSRQIGKMTEFVRVKLLQVDFGSQSPARDPYCAVSIKEAVADPGKTQFHQSATKKKLNQ